MTTRVLILKSHTDDIYSKFTISEDAGIFAQKKYFVCVVLFPGQTLRYVIDVEHLLSIINQMANV